MTCRELTDRLRDYGCGCIDCAERRTVEAHLMVCDRCLRYLGEYELTVRLARVTAVSG